MRHHADLKRIKGLIFDFDGTLVDSLGMWKDLDHLYLASRGLVAPPGLSHAIEGLSFDQTAAYFKEQFGIPESIDEIVNEWHEHVEDQYPRLPFKGGAIEFLDKMRNNGYSLGLATSNSHRIVRRYLTEKKILDYFPVLVTSDDVGKGKPEPDVFLEAARRLELAPFECLVFEDTYMGVLGAKRAGMTTVAIYDPHNEEKWKDTLKIADYTLKHYDEFERMIS